MTIIKKPNQKFAAGIPVIIFLSCFLITLTTAFRTNQDLMTDAVVLDLLITAPLAYFIAIRKTGIPKATVFRVLIAGMIFSGLILNAGSGSLLKIVKTFIYPALESALIVFIAVKFYKAIKEAKRKGKKRVDFLIYCRGIMQEVTGSEKAGNIIASEIGVFYYAFAGWKDKSADFVSKFTSYRENGIQLILVTFLSIFLIETIAFHFLLIQWSSTAAWIITVLNLYTCLQLFAHIRAVRARLITLNRDSIELYNGLAGDVIISDDNIEKVEMTDKTPSDRKAVKLALLRKLEKHNCVIYLKKPVQVTLIFGITRRADAVMFYADRAAEFSKELNIILTKLSPDRKFTIAEE